MCENQNSECDTNNKLLVRKTHEYEYQNSEPTLECQAQIDVYKMFIFFHDFFLSCFTTIMTFGKSLITIV